MYKFELGDYVSCKKWSGEKILGIYAYQGRDGSHFIIAENNKRWNIKPNDIKLANIEEVNTIRKKIESKLGNFKLEIINFLKNKPKIQELTKAKSIKKEEDELLELVTSAD